MLLRDYIKKLQEFEALNPNLKLVVENYSSADEDDDSFIIEAKYQPCLGYYYPDDASFQPYFEPSPESMLCFFIEDCNAILIR